MRVWPSERITPSSQSMMWAPAGSRMHSPSSCTAPRLGVFSSWTQCPLMKRGSRRRRSGATNPKSDTCWPLRPRRRRPLVRSAPGSDAPTRWWAVRCPRTSCGWRRRAQGHSPRSSATPSICPSQCFWASLPRCVAMSSACRWVLEKWISQGSLSRPRSTQSCRTPRWPLNSFSLPSAIAQSVGSRRAIRWWVLGRHRSPM